MKIQTLLMALLRDTGRNRPSKYRSKGWTPQETIMNLAHRGHTLDLSSVKFLVSRFSGPQGNHRAFNGGGLSRRLCADHLLRPVSAQRQSLDGHLPPARRLRDTPTSNYSFLSAPPGTSLRACPDCCFPIPCHTEVPDRCAEGNSHLALPLRLCQMCCWGDRGLARRILKIRLGWLRAVLPRSRMQPDRNERSLFDPHHMSGRSWSGPSSYVFASLKDLERVIHSGPTTPRA